MPRRKKYLDVLAFLRNDWFIDWLREDIKTRKWKRGMTQEQKIWNRRLSTKQRRKIGVLHKLGVPLSEIAKLIGCSTTTVRRWTRKQKKGGQKDRA